MQRNGQSFNLANHESLKDVFAKNVVLARLKGGFWRAVFFGLSARS